MEGDNGVNLREIWKVLRTSIPNECSFCQVGNVHGSDGTDADRRRGGGAAGRRRVTPLRVTSSARHDGSGARTAPEVA